MTTKNIFSSKGCISNPIKAIKACPSLPMAIGRGKGWPACSVGRDGAFRLFEVNRVLILLLLILIVAGFRIKFKSNVSVNQNRDIDTVFKLSIDSNNPRNCEEDFVTSKDGHLLLNYSHYTGTSDDEHGSAFVEGWCSFDKGKIWTKNGYFIASKAFLILK